MHPDRPRQVHQIANSETPNYRHRTTAARSELLTEQSVKLNPKAVQIKAYTVIIENNAQKAKHYRNAIEHVSCYIEAAVPSAKQHTVNELINNYNPVLSYGEPLSVDNLAAFVVIETEQVKVSLYGGKRAGTTFSAKTAQG